MIGQRMFGRASPLLWTIVCLFGALAIGTLVRTWMLRGHSNAASQLHFKSATTWWVLAFVLACSLLCGNVGVAILLMTAGILSMREFLRIVGWKLVGGPTACAVFALIPLYYVILLYGYEENLRSAAPFVFLFVIGSLRAVLGLVQDYVRTTAAVVWGLMLFVFCLSHAYLLMTLQRQPEPWVGMAGWFLYLVLLTESNDIAQALVGRRFGRHKISPHISPNKTMEGLFGGIAVTICLAVILAFWLTNWMQKGTLTSGILLSVLSGLLISICGFLGDINKSGIKRDAGIKDSGSILPGQGGAVDRIDSLTFSAPAFFYFVQSISPDS